MNLLASDPIRPGDPFNRLYDTCRARGLRVGLRASEHLAPRRYGGASRDIVAVEVAIPEIHRVLVEPIDHRGLQAAAHGLLARLPRSNA